MIIDCQSCPVRELHCADCMVSALLAPQETELPLDTAERAAVDRFVSAGLVAPAVGATALARREPWVTHARAVG